MSRQHILISVVVPTFHRPDLLACCLEALLAQEFPPHAYEILVCDDAASPVTELQVRALGNGSRPALRYLPVPAPHGPAAARNLGWLCARGEIVAFTDDDTMAARDWLGQGLRALRPEVAAVVGRVEMPLPAMPTDYERDQHGLTTAEFVTANCFLRKQTLEAVGGFDTRYRLAWREDSDLHFALLAHGYAVARAPLARVQHPLRAAPFCGGLRMQRKVMYDVLLYRKYPHLYRARIRRQPPWHYLGITLILAAAIVAAAAGQAAAALALGAVWLALTLAFFLRRLQGTSRRPRDVLDLALTSALIPPLSIGWRLVGLLRFGGGRLP